MLRVGLIGAGGISAMHLPAYREHPETVRLTAVCDADEDAGTHASEAVRAGPRDCVDLVAAEREGLTRPRRTRTVP